MDMALKDFTVLCDTLGSLCMGRSLCFGEIVQRAQPSETQCVNNKAAILVALCCPHVMMDLVVAGGERD